MKPVLLNYKEKTILYVLDTDNTLHVLTVYDNSLTDKNLNPVLIEKIEKELGIEIVDYWVSKEIIDFITK